MRVEFESDADTAGRGFTLDYHATPLAQLPANAPEEEPESDSCSGGEVLTELSGVIAEGVGEYSNAQRCTWLIRPTSTAVEYIRLEFDEIDLEDASQTITIYDGDSVNARVLGKFSGTSIPGAVTSTGRVIFVAFTTDQSGSGAGFAARWRSYGKNIPNLAFDSCPDWECAGVGASVGDRCTDGGNYTCCDVKHAECQFLPCWYPGTTCPSGPGGQASLPPANPSPDTEQCLGRKQLTANSGVISESPTMYGANSQCEWLIKPACPSACTIMLSFTAFALEAGFDFLEVYDGAGPMANLIGRYTGNTLPPTAVSITGSMLMVFTSDQDTNDDGFEALYEVKAGILTSAPSARSARCPTQANLTTSQGQISDGAGDYTDSTVCSWLIRVPKSQQTSGGFLTLVFDKFSTEVGYDVLTVYDGDTPHSPLLLRASGTTLPPQVSASNWVMLVVFTSDSSTTSDGFEVRPSSALACTGACWRRIRASTPEPRYPQTITFVHLSTGLGLGALQAHFLATSTHAPTSAPTASFDARVVYLEAPAGNGHGQLSYMAYQSEFGSDLDVVRLHPLMAHRLPQFAGTHR
jgi:hypothetical protein